MRIGCFFQGAIVLGLVLLTNLDLAAQSIDFRLSSFKFSASHRFRIETWDNATSLSAAAAAGNSYLRVRSRFSIAWRPAKPIEFNVRLANEFRYNFVPENRKFTLDEVFFDQLNFVWTNFGSYGIDLIFGRQDMFFGDGFLVADGGPLDGSRSAYFNAVRTIWKVSEKNRLNVFYCIEPEKDRFLPQLNSQEKKLVEVQEQGWGVYYSSNGDNLALDIYQIARYGSRRVGRESGENDHTLGFRTVVNRRGSIIFTGEFACQLSPEIDFGGVGEIEYRLVAARQMPKRLAAGMIVLSGDQEESGGAGWNPMFARWPKWSESYIYTLTLENGAAYWTNLFSVYVSSSIDLHKTLELQIRYHRLMAFAESQTAVFPGGGGRVRGDLAIGHLLYKITDGIKGHFLCEYFNPGNYYFAGADDYLWARAELLISY